MEADDEDQEEENEGEGPLEVALLEVEPVCVVTVVTVQDGVV